jgi:hypothetical protein
MSFFSSKAKETEEWYQKRLKNGLDTTVIFVWILFYKARKTGTVMATSPMAESHDIICVLAAKYYFFN